MRAIDIDVSGHQPELKLTQQPAPTPGPGEVLVDVSAAGVNRADLAQAAGKYPAPRGESEILGLEISGRIAALGAGDTGQWRVGDEVCALLAGGGYAEQTVVPVGQLLPVPQGIDLVAAAALPEVGCTVWSTLVMTAGLGKGQTVLLHGGSSGIGTMGIQVSRALGATVAVTAGSQAKLKACRELGADIVINYRESDFVEELSAANSGHGADVILDVVGGDYLTRNVEALAEDGHLVIIGMMGGATGELPIARLLRKRGSVSAISLRGRDRDDKARVVSAVRENLWPMVASGHVRPIIHEVLPLQEAQRAHEVLKASDHIGKVLLQVR